MAKKVIKKKKRCSPKSDLKNWHIDFEDLGIDEFPYCCGIEVLRGFPLFDDRDDPWRGHPPNKIYGLYIPPDETLDESTELAPKTIWKPLLEKEISIVLGDTPDRMGIMATLNELQIKDIGPILKKFGFKQREKFFGEGHNRNIYVFFRPPIRGKSVKKSTFGG